jgi:hypothetical protein
MVKINIKLAAADEHKLITMLEMVQWDIAGGATEGEGWKIETDNGEAAHEN